MRLFGKKALPLYTMLIVISGLILLSAMLFFVLFQWYAGNVSRETARLLSVAADEYVESIETKLGDYLAAEELVALDQSVRDNIFRRDVSSAEMVDLGKQLKKTIDSLTYFFYRSGEVYSYYLYTFLPGDGAYFRSLEAAKREWWYDDLQALEQSSLRWYSYSKIAGSYQYTMARAISDFGSSASRSGAEQCCQTITINLNALFPPEYNVFRGQTAEIYVFRNEDGEQVYANGAHTGEAAELFEALSGGAGEERLNGPEKLTVLSRPIELMDATVVLLFSPSRLDVQGYFSETTAAVVITALFVLLLSFLLWFYLRFRSRIEQVIRTIDSFDESGGGSAAPLSDGDEIARIDRHVLRMQNRIRSLIQREYAAKMQMLSARMEAMSVCINPHFLYNTLNAISSMACMEGADRTVEMIDALGGMFRYSCDMRKKFVPLRAELANISDYLFIQKLRFSDALRCQTEVPEELLCMRVPKLVLQPLVENAFKHGFAGNRSGSRELTVTAERQGDALLLTVLDNGRGIPPEALADLRRELESTSDPAGSDARIGLYNVHRRVRMLCGPECGLTLESAENRFTRVVLRLPALEDGDEFPLPADL